jgi:hypothetical protein
MTALTVIGLRGDSRTERACGDQDACNPNTKRHEPRQRCDRLESDPAIAAFKHRIRRTARKRGQAQNSSTPCAKSARRKAAYGSASLAGCRPSWSVSFSDGVTLTNSAVIA